MGRRWSFVLPYERPPLSANRRKHWAPAHKEYRETRNDLYYLAIHWRQKHGLVNVGRVNVTLIWYPGNDRRADSDNISDTLKPILDGMTLAKVWPDDNHRYVKRTASEVIPYSEDPERRTRPTVMLEIEEVATGDESDRPTGDSDQLADGRLRTRAPERHRANSAHRPRKSVSRQRYRRGAGRARG